MTPSKYQVFVDPDAAEKMFAHVRFLAQVSVTAAERLYSEMNTAINSLKTAPRICARYEPKRQMNAELRYKLCGKRYRIVFEIVENNVYVCDIQDCRQNSDKYLI